LFIPDPNPDFLPIPDPGSGSATLPPPHFNVSLEYQRNKKSDSKLLLADKSVSGAHVQKNRIFAALRYVPQKTREIVQTGSGIFCQTDAFPLCEK
jgi:hypothetical protein